MAAARVLVKRLAAIENLGSMDVLCSDKTGTLTEGRCAARGVGCPRPAERDEVRRYAYLNAYYETGFSDPIDEAVRTTARST